MSPDGTRIAFSSSRDGIAADIYLLDVRSGEVSQVTDHPAEEVMPARSPDGQRLVFVRNGRG